MGITSRGALLAPLHPGRKPDPLRVNDHGQLRSYRVDRIAGIRATTDMFTPRFRVEF
ncbi:MAG: hypothetical protein LC749_12715 [Actinobacteria bacterium]|nr:hypothetical protein [Actinomycetota bacterium]